MTRRELPPVHGTDAGHQRHVVAREKPCEACREAHAAYERARKARRREQLRPGLRCAPGLGWPLEASRG